MLWSDGAQSPTKRAEIYCTTFEKFGYDPLPIYIEPMESPISRPDLVKKYPLVGDACIKTVLYTHSQMRTIPLLRDIMPDPWVAINPIKAGEIGINDRDMVSVESPRGEIRLKAQLTEEVTDPDTVFMPYGWGQPYTGDYPIVNILTPDMPRCPISASTANHCFLCRIRKA